MRRTYRGFRVQFLRSLRRLRLCEAVSDEHARVSREAVLACETS
jgi:hypothetical protein